MGSAIANDEFGCTSYVYDKSHLCLQHQSLNPVQEVKCKYQLRLVE